MEIIALAREGVGCRPGLALAAPSFTAATEAPASV
jgi:hypothetical protein